MISHHTRFTLCGFILKWLSENSHFLATFPMLNWAQTWARLQRCDQCMNGLLNQIMYAPIWCSQFRFRALCDAFGVLRGDTLYSHASKSPVSHLNHWCATLRDRTSYWPFHIWITKGRKPVFSDNHFNCVRFYDCVYHKKPWCSMRARRAQQPCNMVQVSNFNRKLVVYFCGIRHHQG